MEVVEVDIRILVGPEEQHSLRNRLRAIGNRVEIRGIQTMKLRQVKEIVSCLRYKDWWFFIRTRKGEMYLQVEFVARDSGSGPAAMQKGRKWFVSKHATESELVFTALKAVLTAEEHEAREGVRYLGRAIVNPHISVKTLWRGAKRNRQKETMNGFIYV